MGEVGMESHLYVKHIRSWGRLKLNHVETNPILNFFSIHPHALSLNDTEVYFLFFLVFSIMFMFILGLLLCFYCKKKMWERERWTEIMQSSEMDSDCSGSWISINSSTQVSPILYTPTKDKDGDEFDELFWLKRKLEISPSILV